jgi:hypothetical protein
VRLLADAPRFKRAVIRVSGIPQRPKPPTRSVAPVEMSETATSADSTTLLENVLEDLEKKLFDNKITLREGSIF